VLVNRTTNGSAAVSTGAAATILIGDARNCAVAAGATAAAPGATAAACASGAAGRSWPSGVSARAGDARSMRGEGATVTGSATSAKVAAALSACSVLE
jgi:hypothetical protein